jgi:hypothetical protein
MADLLRNGAAPKEVTELRGQSRPDVLTSGGSEVRGMIDVRNHDCGRDARRGEAMTGGGIAAPASMLAPT